ncbi:MAG TPA: HAMP domain-containing sensor histidine kinase [Acidimicrobiia bacterium]|nr:HAMP domain-containing sensor histidine kinase [Acidimicrobiia bacterium]
MSLDGFLTESHIVVIGDDPTSLRLLQQALNSDGYRRVNLTSDPQQAESFFIGREPDLVLIDLHLPRVETWKLLEHLRGFVPVDVFIPFLLLTSDLTALERRQALKAGATDLLVKPIDFEELSLRVGRLLDTRRLTVTLQREREMLASMVADQTEEKALELIRTNTALERLVRAKDEFIASVSHELRTPLTAVVGFARKLSDHPDQFGAEEAAAITRIIAEQSSDVAAIIDDLLVAARAEIGRVRVLAERVDLRAEIEAASQALSARREAIRLPQVTAVARGDRLRVRQILRNLLVNAVRYGGSEVVVEIVPSDQTVTVKVVDDGPGIPLMDREHLFEPYFHGAAAVGQPASIGLGLTVSRQLARLMGGDLVYSQEARGSLFELTLPSGIELSIPG